MHRSPVQRARRLGGGLLPALVLAACATPKAEVVRGYAGTARPPAEVTELRCGNAVAILAVDGDPRLAGDPSACAFELLPGWHRFRFRIKARQYGDRITFLQDGSQVVGYQLEAGRHYVLSAISLRRHGAWSIILHEPDAGRVLPLQTLRLE